MKGDTSAIRPEVDARARQSLGISDSAIYGMVVRLLDERRISGGELIDVVCGAGNLWTSSLRAGRLRGLRALGG